MAPRSWRGVQGLSVTDSRRDGPVMGPLGACFTEIDTEFRWDLSRAWHSPALWQAMRALNRHYVPELNRQGKEPHWGRRKLKRDERGPPA